MYTFKIKSWVHYNNKERIMNKRKILVKEVMKREVVTVREATTLKELMGIFQKYTFHTLPVVKEDNRIVGVVALEDILKIFEPVPPHVMELVRRNPLWNESEERRINLFETDLSPEMGVLCIVKDFMRTDVVTIDEEATTVQARALMKLHDIRRLPVVDKDGYLKGIISLFDIILAVFKEKGIL